MDLNEAAIAIGNEFLPLFDELTTSDLQGAIEAEVINRGLPREVENMALEYIYEQMRTR